MSTTPAVVPHPKQTSPVFGMLFPLPGSSVKSILPLVCGQVYAIGRDMKVCDVGDVDNPYMSKSHHSAVAFIELLVSLGRIHVYIGTSLVLGQWRAWIKDTNSTNGVWVCQKFCLGHYRCVTKYDVLRSGQRAPNRCQC